MRIYQRSYALILSICLFPLFALCQTEGLIGYFAFNGSAIDSSEYEHHGAVVGAQLGDNLLGEANKAYIFNGQDSYITAGTDATLKVDTALTISLWFRATGPGTPATGGILANKEGEYSFARFADGSIRYALAFNNVWDAHVNTGITVPLNEDTHAALVYSQALGKVQVYINCELIYETNENAIIGDQVPTQNEMRIGGRMFFDQYFEGTIDEVKIFNRALSFEEVQTNCLLTDTEDLITQGNQDFLIYPNPIKGSLHLDGDLSKIELVKIFNSTGQLIKEIHSDFGNINIQNSAAGYFVVAIYGKGHQLIQAKKIFKAAEPA